MMKRTNTVRTGGRKKKAATKAAANRRPAPPTKKPAKRAKVAKSRQRVDRKLAAKAR